MKEILQSDIQKIERFLDKKITRRDVLMWSFLGGVIITGGISITMTLREIIDKSQGENKDGPAEKPKTPSRTN